MVSYVMIHSARPTVSPVAKIVLHFILLNFEKWGRTDDVSESNDPSGRNCGLAKWIKNKI